MKVGTKLSETDAAKAIGKARKGSGMDLQLALVICGLVLGLAVWGYLDVRVRGRMIPGRPDLHMTDFTVYTNAGKAMLEGRDPYESPNFRGWYYLYPPLFALMVAPLARFEGSIQVFVWFLLNLGAGLLCYLEVRKLWKLVSAPGGPDRETTGRLPWILGICAFLACFPPLLECLQRGQMGIVLVYPLLLGLRLSLGARGTPGRLLAGFAWSWPIVAKLVPALPIGFALTQAWLIAARTPSQGAARRAGALTLGLAIGLLAFTLALPAASIGWGANLKHLNTWFHKMVMTEDPGHGGRFDITTDSNQSLEGSIRLAANRFRGANPDEIWISKIKSPTKRMLARIKSEIRARHADRLSWVLVQSGRLLVLGLLAFVCMRSVRQGDPLSLASGFGLAMLAIVLISPVAYRHYYVFAIGAAVFAPLDAARSAGQKRGAALAAALAGLVIVHFIAMPLSSSIGLLGMGTLVWFAAASVSLLTPVQTPPLLRAEPRGAHYGGLSVRREADLAAGGR